MSIVQAVIDWFNKAKPEPKEKDVVVQMGVHFEEVAEMLTTLLAVDSLTPTTIEQLNLTNKAMLQLAKHFKNDATEISLSGMDTHIQEELLDAVLDQAVTGIGICTFLNQDYNGALLEVNRSNYSKFNDEGKPVFLDNGKIGKSANYSKPNLKPFLGENK